MKSECEEYQCNADETCVAVRSKHGQEVLIGKQTGGNMRAIHGLMHRGHTRAGCRAMMGGEQNVYEYK